MALPLSNHHDCSRQLHSLNLFPDQWPSLHQTRRRQVNQQTQTYKARKGGSSHSIIRLMSSLDVVTYFVTRCECVCRVWAAAPAPPLWLLPWVQFHLFLIPLPPLRPPLVPWNTSQFPQFPFSRFACFANKCDLHFIPHPFPKRPKLT